MLTVHDYEREALLRLPPSAADYYQGGAEDEVTLRTNCTGWGRWALRQRVLVDVSNCDTSVSVLGERLHSPLLIAPTAFHALAHPDGKLATARAAAAAGTCLVVSTLSNYRLEDIAAAASGPLWFQLYVYRERALSEALVKRAEAAGYRAIVLTVDVPVSGARERDIRNGFALPDGLQAGNFADTLAPRQGASSLAHYINTLLDPTLDWRILDWLRAQTTLPIVVKGVMTAADAQRAAAGGAAAIVVSNHGGRQLDGGEATADVFPDIVAAVPGIEIYVDGGIRRGGDVLKALALGARAVLLGRPVLWGLAVAGQSGVARILDILQQELHRSMQFCGCRGVHDVTAISFDRQVGRRRDRNLTSMQAARTPLGAILAISLLSAVFGSSLTMYWVRLSEPAPAHAQSPEPVSLAAPAMMSSQAVEQAADVIGPSVVNVDTESIQTAQPLFPPPFVAPGHGAPHPEIQSGVGSGIIVSPDGYIVTNEHVIHGASEIKVTLTTHAHYRATVAGVDKLSDLAILKIDADNLPVASFADSSQVRVGEWVLAIGNPYQFEHSVTVGIISGRGRTLPDSYKEYRDLLQTDAAINPGNSGGPLCDLQGRVIGINTAILPYAQGIGFAIPTSVVQPIMQQLIEHGSVTRAFIGVSMNEVTAAEAPGLHLPTAVGVLVMGVIPDSPAKHAGLRHGDVIVRFAGRQFDSATDFQTLVRAERIGSTQDLDYVRDGQLKSIRIAVAAMPDLEQVQTTQGNPAQERK